MSLDITAFDGFTKVCTGCGAEKALSEFHKHKLGEYGLNPKCKACRSQAKPKPVVTEGMKRCTKCQQEFLPTLEFFAADKRQKSGMRPECRICQSKYQQKYMSDHREELNAKARERHARNPELRREINRRSIARNPHHHRELQRLSAQRRPRSKAKELVKRMRRYSLKQSLPTDFTPADWTFALDYFDSRCAVCGKPAGLWHVIAADHWIPVHSNKEGNPGTVPTNIVPLCHSKKGMPVGEPSCNQDKSNHDPLEWLTRKYGRKATEINERIQAFFAEAGRHHDNQ